MRSLTGDAPYQPIINITNAGDIEGLAEAPNVLPPLLKTLNATTNLSEYALSYDAATLQVEGSPQKLGLAAAVKTKVDRHETLLTTGPIVLSQAVGPPTTGTRSIGTKYVLYSNVSPSEADFALGMMGSAQWSSVPSATAFFRWYAGTQNIMTLDGYGSTFRTGNLDGGIVDVVSNASAGANAFSQYRLATNSNVNSGAVWLLNGSNRTVDGGANTATLRNDIGALRLQSKGGKGLTIAADTGGITLDAGPVIFPQNINPPSVTTRSLGTRLCLYQGVTATNVDYAIGVENGALWYSASTTGDVHKFYTGPTHVATIGNNYIGLHRADAPISYELATNISLARSGGVGHYFTGSVAGDACIRNSTNRIMLGASASTPHLTINTNGSIDMPGPTQMTSAVNGIYRFINAKNTSTANGAYTMLNLENSGTAGFNWFLNGTATTVEGGANSGTLRNDAGALRLQAKGSKGLTIAADTGAITLDAGPIVMTQSFNPPSVATRSTGTKVVLFPGIDATSVDFALGVEGSAQWYSVPTSSSFHKFYTGPTHAATIGTNYIEIPRTDAPTWFGLGPNISLARSSAGGQYFTGSVAGDTCFRNTTNRILLGATTANPHMIINTNGTVDIPGTLTVGGQAVTGGSGGTGTGTNNPTDPTRRFTFRQGMARPTQSNFSITGGISSASAMPALDLTNATLCAPSKLIVTGISMRFWDVNTNTAQTVFPGGTGWDATAIQHTVTNTYGSTESMLGINILTKQLADLPPGDDVTLIVTAILLP